MRAPVERRLAAILAADVAGYSRLIGADEEGTLSRLRAIRADLFDPEIAEHRGRIARVYYWAENYPAAVAAARRLRFGDGFRQFMTLPLAELRELRPQDREQLIEGFRKAGVDR